MLYLNTKICSTQIQNRISFYLSLCAHIYMFATAGRTAEPNWLNKFGYLKNALARLGSLAELKYHKDNFGYIF